MDVDKLRPGTVPLVPEAVLWFEFLLDKDLLEIHLRKPNPDPSAIDLIVSFLNIESKDDMVVGNVNEQDADVIPVVPKLSKRSLALKTLSFKTAAFLNWNLDILESKLPLPMQVTLLHNLIYAATGEDVNIAAHSSLSFKKCDEPTIFAIVLNHRWVVRSVMSSSLVTKQPKVPFIPIPGLQDPNIMAANQQDEIKLQLENQVNDSISVLLKVLSDVKRFTIPTLNSFAHIAESTTDVNMKWEDGVIVPEEEIKCQIHYELGCYHFFREQYETAKHHFTQCYQLFTKREANPALRSSQDYCLVARQLLEQYCSACGVEYAPTSQSTDLLTRFKTSIGDQYSGILQILEQDNWSKVIPLIDRDMLEVEVQTFLLGSTVTVSKDFLLKIQLNNVLRRAVTNEAAPDFYQFLFNSGEKGLEIFLQILRQVLDKINEREFENVKYFVLDCVVQDKECTNWLTNRLLSQTWINKLFNSSELDKLKVKPNLVPSACFDKPAISITLINRSPRLEIQNIERQIISTYDVSEIDDLLHKLCTKDPERPWAKLNNKWDLPIPLQSVVMSLPKGFLQDFVYILLAKAKEMNTAKNYKRALLLLDTAERNVKESHMIPSSVMYKLGRLMSWEALLIHINHYLDDYPNSGVDVNYLINECKSCLAVSQAGDSVLPRTEVVEHCTLTLLNLGEWEILTSMDKRWTYLEFAAAIAEACQDIMKYMGNKKVTRDAWDLVLPAFGPSTTVKRTNTGATASPSGVTFSKNTLVTFLTKLRDTTCLSVVISLLARLHNVLKDEDTLQIHVEYTALWPAVVSNSNSYNIRHVTDVLLLVLTESLKYLPNHVPWIKVIGDVYYVSSDWSSAFRYYLEACALASDYFIQPIPRTVIEDQVYKRMIKCCCQLQCHTQAAVMCQFLDNVDYTTAFKCLSETKTTQSADAMDAYYPCIWDLTILEYLVNMHSNRGETLRKQQVIKIIGLLELNGNNNEEIQREAANIRRCKFLRAMAKQYSISAHI